MLDITNKTIKGLAYQNFVIMKFRLKINQKFTLPYDLKISNDNRKTETLLLSIKIDGEKSFSTIKEIIDATSLSINFLVTPSCGEGYKLFDFLFWDGEKKNLYVLKSL